MVGVTCSWLSYSINCVFWFSSLFHDKTRRTQEGNLQKVTWRICNVCKFCKLLFLLCIKTIIRSMFRKQICSGTWQINFRHGLLINYWNWQNDIETDLWEIWFIFKKTTFSVSRFSWLPSLKKMKFFCLFSYNIQVRLYHIDVGNLWWMTSDITP